MSKISRTSKKSKTNKINKNSSQDETADSTWSNDLFAPHTLKPLQPRNNTSLAARSTKQYIQAATSDNTRRAYRSAIKHFIAWGGLLPTDENTLIRYLVDHAETLNPRTLDVRIAAIRQWHTTQNITDPTRTAMVQKTLVGIRRQHGKPKKKAAPLQPDHVIAMLHVIRQQSNTLKALRDEAILLIGFFGAFRPSELAALDTTWLAFEEEGVVITLPRSKTDQTGEGKMTAIPYAPHAPCPARSLQTWIDEAGITDGAVFRSITRWGSLAEKALTPASINTLLKNWASAAGLKQAEGVSGHSLRRGFTTSAILAGADFKAVKKQGNWTVDETVWAYFDEALRFTDNASHALYRQLHTNPQDGS